MIPTKSDISYTLKKISPYIHRTPVISSDRINKIFNSSLYFKCENLQKAGVFKSRGAINAVFSLSDKECINGVATHSSGNHAQALARAAKIKGIDSYIVMPEDSSKVKIDAVKSYGGNIIFCKSDLESRETTLTEVIKKTNAVEIHPYNNYKIITGQATAAMEFFEEIKKPDIIFAPVGGGGLLSGTALATHYFSPSTKVIAAEPIQADDAFKSFYSQTFIPSVKPQTIADGLRTSLGSITFPIILKYVNQIITVKEQTIVEMMKLFWESTKLIIEPSSAVCLAAIYENRNDFKNKEIGIIISGGNVDLEKLPWNQNINN